MRLVYCITSQKYHNQDSSNLTYCLYVHFNGLTNPTVSIEKPNKTRFLQSQKLFDFTSLKKMSTVILVSFFPRLNRSNYFMMLWLKHIGHRCIWRHWGSHSLRTLRERLSCQSVSTYLTLYIVLLF